MTVDEKISERLSAIHQAGHAVARVRLDVDRSQVSIHLAHSLPRGAPGADFLDCWDSQTAFDLALVHCCGYGALVASGVPEDDAEIGAGLDFEQATELIEFWGLKGSLEEYKLRATDLMRRDENFVAVRRVAEQLRSDDEIDAEMLEILVDLADGNTTQEEFDRYCASRDRK